MGKGKRQEGREKRVRESMEEGDEKGKARPKAEEISPPRSCLKVGVCDCRFLCHDPTPIPP